MPGYSQVEVAELLTSHADRVTRILDHPGHGGMDGLAPLMDLRRGLLAVSEALRGRAEEWMHGPPAGDLQDRGMTPTAERPLLVDDLGELRAALVESHSAPDHIVIFNGSWTAGATLMRALDDTLTVRRIGRRMSTKQSRPRLTTANREWLLGHCDAGCGRDIGPGDGIVFEPGTNRRWHEACFAGLQNSEASTKLRD